jgi:alpha-glucuronidase
MSRLWVLVFGVLCATVPGTFLRAETGHDGWLSYARLDRRAGQKYQALPARVVVLGDAALLQTAETELIRGVKGLLGRSLRPEASLPPEPAIILGTLAELEGEARGLEPENPLQKDGFWLTTQKVRGHPCVIITATGERGVLYGVFALLRKIAHEESLDSLHEVQQPYASIRWVNQWDNLNGTIERGYAGPSIFFDGGSVRSDLTRAAEYARLLASIGINGCAVNNVNADPRMLEDVFLPQLVRIAEVFRRWGVQLSLSVDVSSPKVMGGLDTFDPMDPRVAAWWRKKFDQIYSEIPDFGGVVVKADSEGRLGPTTYGRTPADAANTIARALQPHGGLVLYRAFVYNHHLDWRDLKNDRARAAYDIFHPLDGKFDDNVIVQIKYGPIDFQVREPVSPLLGGLENTNEAIELQITQEYTGQQRHLCFLAPMWKEVLDFDMHVGEGHATAKDLVAGRAFHRRTGGLVGVANVGMDNWLGNPLAMANLYAFGRLAWDPDLSAQTIIDEWIRLTFGNDPVVVRTLSGIQLSSWSVYESYTGPLGAGTLTNILGSHYGPGPESSEGNGWGQWHRADQSGVGMDRTVVTGTGYVGQYAAPVAKIYESLETTPDQLLLFFHHVPYSYRLHSGKTVIQHIYDSHYEGAERAYEYLRQWQSLKGRIDADRYAAVLSLLRYQAGHALVWRDAICNYFYHLSGIADEHGRVGHHPDRIEAEDMQLQGYKPFEAVPWESASGGKGIECPEQVEHCTATFRLHRPRGRYELDVQYFDQNNGQAKFRVFVGNRAVDDWVADAHLPSTKPNGDSSTRRWIAGVELRPGDEIRIEGTPDPGERAALDYIEIHPSQD